MVSQTYSLYTIFPFKIAKLSELWNTPSPVFFSQHIWVFLELGELFNRTLVSVFFWFGSFPGTWLVPLLHVCHLPCPNSHLSFLVSTFHFTSVSVELLILFSSVLFLSLSLFSAFEILVFSQCFIVSPRPLLISACCFIF